MCDITIKEFDKNFIVDTDLDLNDVTYYNVKENQWCLHGLLCDEVFRRMPIETAEKVNDGILFSHFNTSGGRLRFITDSPYVAIVAKMPNKSHFAQMSLTGTSGFDMYVDKRYHSTFVPSADGWDIFSSVSHFDNSAERNITINFPLFNVISDLLIGIKEGSSLKKAQDYECKEKIVFYGSSITQGGCVSRPGLAYPAFISNELGCDYVNLGFSRSALGEDIMAEYIASLNPDIFVIDYDHNAPDEEHLKNTHEKFFKTFRNQCPNTPVVIISAPNIKFYPNWKARKEIIKTTYNNAIEKGDRNVYFIDGEKLWGEEHWDSCTMDGFHPNDLGHFKMAQGIMPTIREIISR